LVLQQYEEKLKELRIHLLTTHDHHEKRNQTTSEVVGMGLIRNCRVQKCKTFNLTFFELQNNCNASYTFQFTKGKGQRIGNKR
jgi:hypothetical protein